MAQKNTKSIGNILGQSREYWQNAAKQFIWPIDFEHKHILVPEKDLELAMLDLMVCHFRAAGWHVQSAIDINYTKVFTPEQITKPLFPDYKKQVIADNAKYKPGDKFKIRSTDCELEITFMNKDSIELRYLNRASKAPIVSNEKQITKSLNLCAWVKI